MKSTIIIYDFDGTLTPYSVPNLKLIKDLGYTSENYEKKMKEWLGKNANGTIFDAYYMTYLDILKSHNIQATDETFAKEANLSDYNPGVISYFKTVDTLADHYLLSSGFKVPLTHSPIAKYFTEIYGTLFSYDDFGFATGIHYAMSDKKKVDKIKEICLNNNLLDYDCTNVIYIGDGLTDAYAMDFVTKHGGTSIFVYHKEEDLLAFDQLKEKGIVNLAFEANYESDSELHSHLLDFIKR